MNEVHRDALSAWHWLCESGGLEPDGRDHDLVDQIKEKLDGNAPDLLTALASASTDQFVQAFFQTAQQFALMFKDILDFFQQAGAREGQQQWKISINNCHAELSHFEKFLTHWNKIKCELEVPAVDLASAFILNNVRHEFGGKDYLCEGRRSKGPHVTGVRDVDEWLVEYHAGRYAPLPESLNRENLGAGLDDAVGLVAAALSIIKEQGLNKEEMLSEHRARRFRCDRGDGLHVWTISQNETDDWLYNCVWFLGNLLKKSEQERKKISEMLSIEYGNLPRRRFGANIQLKELERILSLPAWTRRYEFFGVWIATEIVRSLEGHDLVLNHSNGELKFAFREAKIADILSSQPMLGLFSERKTGYDKPVSQKRTGAVQPDFGIWAHGRDPENCRLVIEVKHYKKPSRRNFEEALIDYAGAHPAARVLLVNHGSVRINTTAEFEPVKDRCEMIGNLNPLNKRARDEFRDLVRARVGEPKPRRISTQLVSENGVVAVDISQSMSSILASAWFGSLLHELKGSFVPVAFIDEEIRAIVQSDQAQEWLSRQELGVSTRLSGPISDLLRKYASVVLVTDPDGRKSVADLNASMSDLDPIDEFGIVCLLISIENDLV